MSLFDRLGGSGRQAPQTQPQMSRAQMMQQLQADPAGILKQAGLSLPDGMTDPQQMVNYLFQSGQIMPRTLRRR